MVMAEKYSSSKEKDTSNFWLGVGFLGALALGDFLL